MNIDRDLVGGFYRQMQLIRRFEEAGARLYMQGAIRGFLHLYVGQEAIAVGAISTLGPDDYVISHYRDHGHALARGMDPKVVMAELCGKATGSSGGRGGSMHLYDANLRFMGGHAIVAAQLPIAVGLALASQYRAEDSVVLCFFGDGAVNEGEFHESLNLASLWKLPVLFFLENNLYGMGSHIDQTHAAGRDIYTAAEYYKIPAVQIDGMDLMAVRESTMEALTQVRSGTGPVFLEAMTYRYRGHSMADPEAYRETSELDEWRANDPIERFKTFALAEALISEEELAEIEKDAADAIDEAVTFAQESPDPEMGSLYDNVYA